MKYTENAVNILTATNYKRIGRAWIVKNLKGNESVDEIVSMLNNKSRQEELITIDNFEFNRNQIINKIAGLGDYCDGLLALGDKNFPGFRGTVKESEQPVYLFYKGDINLLDIENPKISVIGLRDPDENIVKREQKLVAEIIKNAVTTVSGLAFGCDTIAHKQSLNGGKTVAILPSPLNDILPATNKDLAHEIVEKGGLLITEYYEWDKSNKTLITRYKERDRLQALFCDTIILVASYALDSATRWGLFSKKLDTGARLAMEYAKNYNTPSAVMYDKNKDIKNPMFDLNRQLISERKSIKILTNKILEEIINTIKLYTDEKRTVKGELFG
ncbi:MAG: DNA-protecting protein DprA [Dysgonamonadaceae bacterium]|jgi:DNA processing protein|nr:DNA-protecting protein DprA [Dysgonamonadaceae bacterium]